MKDLHQIIAVEDVQMYVDEGKRLLDVASAAYSQLPFDYLLVGHCLCVAALMRKLRDRYLLSYWVSFAAAFGGGVVSALLLCDRHVAPQPLFTVNSVGIIWTVCWWAINYSPGDVAFTLYSLLPVRLVCKSCLQVMRVGLMVARVNLAVQLFPGVIAAPLVLGTVGGSAGKFVVDAILTVAGDHTGPTELAQPSFLWRSGFLCTASYYTLVHVAHLLSQEQGKALVLTLFLLHSVLQDVTGLPCDFTAPFAAIAHTLLNVPRPGAIKAEVVNGKAKKTQ